MKMVDVALWHYYDKMILRYYYKSIPYKRDLDWAMLSLRLDHTKVCSIAVNDAR